MRKSTAGGGGRSVLRTGLINFNAHLPPRTSQVSIKSEPSSKGPTVF